ncbi:helix-turn-helix domain-containing protein [Nitrolancea hollandica]|uniref:helix-turn-helix domain-containing protein n=1 Tax=Nitrolancea hollandica TaxID=1206749 RepID=UPI0002F880E9
MEERWLTVSQVAERLQLSPKTVRRWLNEERMRGTYLSDRAGWRIPESEVTRILREGIGHTDDSE